MGISVEKTVMLLVLVIFVSVSSTFLFFDNLAKVEVSGAASGTLGFCVNWAPQIAVLPNQTAFVGVLFNFTVNATDKLDALFYETNSTLFNISNSTGLINFTPTVGQIGTHLITISVTDNSSCGSATKSAQMILFVEAIAAVGKPVLEAWLLSNNDDVLLNWSNVSDADSYIVYYSNNLSLMLSLNDTNIPASVNNVSGITVLNYTDTSAKFNKSKYYRVAAFTQGNINLSDETAGKLDIPLSVGFNLVSTPFSLKFNDLTGYDPARTRPANSIDTLYDTNFNKVDRLSSQWWPATNSNLNLIEGGKGYFANANQVSNLTFAGLVLNSFNVSLNAGFNLVGWFDAFETLLGNQSLSKPINTTVNGCVDTIYNFEEDTKHFEKTDFIAGYGYFDATKSNVSTIKPGRGYWFKVNENCDWLR